MVCVRNKETHNPNESFKQDRKTECAVMHSGLDLSHLTLDISTSGV